MSDQTATTLVFLSPLAILWAAFAIAEGVKIVIAIRGERRSHDVA